MLQAMHHAALKQEQAQSVDRFGEISPRHATAMRICPRARVLELTPFRYLMPQAGRSVLDLFSGSGFVSAALRLCFPSTTLVDNSRYLLDTALPGATTVQGDATQSHVIARVPTANLAVCHAGFHHVLGTGGMPTDDPPHAERRIEVLRLWKQRLAPGGRLIIADVPAVGTLVGTRIGRIAENPPIVLSNSETWAAGSTIGKIFRPALDCHSLEGYLTALSGILARYGVRGAEPASFFDRVVSRMSPAGHVAHFESPAQLISLFKSAGFSNVSAFVAPTPWLFETYGEAMWFVQELLGLGKACKSPDLLTADQASTVAAGISRYLHLARLPGGACILSWNLLFVVGENS